MIGSFYGNVGRYGLEQWPMISVRWLLPVLAPIILAIAASAIAQERPLGAKLQAAFDKEQLSGLHSVLVIHNGQILAERYFRGADQRLGETWSMRQHGPETLHDLRSITKSIVGLLYGIALAEGKVPGLNQSLLAQFPEYRDLAQNPKRKAMLIKHALSMTLGTAWNENLSYLDRNNSARLMRYEKDQIRYVLDRPMESEPGEAFVYNGGAVETIARLIERGVGMSIDTYAEAKLFKPLGIRSYEWLRSADGVPVARGGLRLNVHDLAKIGRLVIQKGKFEGRQIVPAAWLEASFEPRATNKNGVHYGYLWWLVPRHWRGLPDFVAGLGNGGQTLAIQRQLNLIVVVFAGNYNSPGDGKLPQKILTKFVVPALTPKVPGR